MSKIKIKNFGPIKEGYIENEGWMDIKKVTVFIGNQGSGKSTVAKLITTFMWMEKALTRGDYNINWFTKKNKLKNQFLSYFRLENYFPDEKSLKKSFIEYEGDSFYIKFENDTLEIKEIKDKKYPLPQIMYVPSERNFAANIKDPKKLSLTSDSMVEFVSEYIKALQEMKGSMKLPINNVEVEYNKQHGVVYIKGNVKDDSYKIKLLEASSGFQSIVPLYLVTWFLANSVKKQSEISTDSMTSDEMEKFRRGVTEIWNNENLTVEQQRIAISVLSSKFNKTAFINIVEEPEQNLFPSSQQKMLNSLLEFNNMNEGNKLIMTTHSPYLINYLTHAVKASIVLDKINSSNKNNLELTEQLNNIIPVNSVVSPMDWIIYELNEADGSIIKLEDYKNLPSDENYLNDSLSQSNDIFINLLEIEDLCR